MTAEALVPTPLPIGHHAARERWGLPDEVEGSVNDPRTREEHGVRWNERWVYHRTDGGRRLVYWHRYDCRAALHESADGSVAPERL